MPWRRVLVVQPYEGAERGQFGVLEFVDEGRGEVDGGGRPAAEDRAERLSPRSAAVRHATRVGPRAGRAAERHHAAQQHGHFGEAVLTAGAEQRFHPGPARGPGLAFVVVHADGHAQPVARKSASSVP